MAKKRTFSDQLRAAIESSDMTRYAISKATGIDQSILSRFVNTDAGLSMENVDKICECLGITLTVPKPTKRKKG